MTAVSTRRAFRCDAKTWTVTVCASSQSRHEIGLRFVHVTEERFLVFSRGLLPSEHDLHSFCEEVLRVFLDRAVVR